MDKMLLKKAAIQSVALMMVVITLSYALQQYQTVTIAASDLETEDDESAINQTLEPTEDSQEDKLSSGHYNASQEIGTGREISELEELLRGIDKSILNQLGENYLVIKKPEGNNITFQLEDLYINKSIRLVLAEMTEDIVDDEMILRVRGDVLFSGSPDFKEIITLDRNDKEDTVKEVITKDFGNDISHGITITTQKDIITKHYMSQILIELDRVYTYILLEDSNYYFIDLRKPSDIYDKILVIDAGHGGKDAGALSKGEQFYEKDINLDILLHLKERLDKENIKVYYTRTADDKVFLRPRVELANAVDCDYFISIHCNANEITGPNGTEILYYNNEFKGVKTIDLAKLFVDELGKVISLKQRGLVEKHKDDVFIMEKSKVPMILIEVGYLTNNNDMNFLSKSVNRKAVAQGIYNGIMRAYNELVVVEEE